VIALGTLVGVWFGDVTGHLIPTLAGHPHAFVIAGMGARSRRLMAGRDVRAFTPLP
jgi:H+/Cl- antiporter ClcA